MLKAGAVCLRVSQKIEALILRLVGRDLLTDDRLVLIFHPVKVVSLQVEHDDSKATHDLGLLFNPLSCMSAVLNLAATRQIHLLTDSVDLLVLELNLPSVGWRALLTHL